MFMRISSSVRIVFLCYMCAEFLVYLVCMISPEITPEILENIRILKNLNNYQEPSEIKQLRAEGLIQPLLFGGERIYSSASKPVLIPPLLRRIRPENWDVGYKLYLNLTYSPWEETKSCKHFITAFAPPGHFQPTALASYSRSGNIWIRYLVEGASGIFTGSIYTDINVSNHGYCGELVTYDSGMTILQKNHHLSEKLKANDIQKSNHRDILVIRNPFKVLISFMNYQSTAIYNKSLFKTKDLKNFVSTQIKKWKQFYLHWLESTRPSNLHVVFYEELVSNPLDGVSKILMFLNLPIDEGRLKCLSQSIDGFAKRKHSGYFNPYDQQQIDLIRRAINTVNEALIKTGKGPLPLHLYEMYEMQHSKVIKKQDNIDMKIGL